MYESTKKKILNINLKFRYMRSLIENKLKFIGFVYIF